MHRLIDFKGFEDVGINLFAPLTVLIGRNAAGKTNLIEGIELLSAIANGMPLHAITPTGRSGELEVRGGLQACPSFGRSAFTLGFLARMWFDGAMHPLEYRVTIESAPIRIGSESVMLDAGETLLFRTTDQDATSSASGDIRIEYNNFARGGRKPKVSVSASRSVLSQYESFAARNKKSAACVSLVRSLRQHLRRAFVFDPAPRRMRAYNRIGDTTLRRDGSNLSAVLHGLGQSQPEALSRILEHVRSIPDALIDGFGFVTTPLGDVMFGLQEHGRPTLSDARILSDGTLRAIAVLTALETAENGARVIIEELDNGLHPSRVSALLNAIRSQQSRPQRRLSVLATTHNPATLNALDEQQLDAVVVAARRQPDGPTDIIPLKDIPRHDELLERGRLGDLVTGEVVQRYLAPRFEEERRTASMAWLRGLDG